MKTKAKQNKSRQDSLALEQRSIPVGRETAKILGSTDAAVILQQLHYWLSMPEVGRVVDGVKYIYNTYKQWLREFPWLSETKWRNCMRHLRKLGIVKFAQLDAREWKQRGWYTIDYQQLKALIPSICVNPTNQPDVSKPIHSLESNESSIYSKKTIKDLPSHSSALANATPEPHPSVCKELEKVFPQEKEEKPATANQTESTSKKPTPDESERSKNKNLELDKYSAAPQLKKRQNDLTMPEGWDEFHAQLFEYAKREGKNSPAAWTGKVAESILADLSAGRPNTLWDDFQQGLPLGAVEKSDREWLNPETGKAWPLFEEALIEHCQNEKGNPNKSRFAAAAEAAAILANPKQAALMWTELKRQIISCKEQWKRQKELGVQTPYLPPHFTEVPEPLLQQAASAVSDMASSQSQLAPAQQACLLVEGQKKLAATKESEFAPAGLELESTQGMASSDIELSLPPTAELSAQQASLSLSLAESAAEELESPATHIEEPSRPPLEDLQDKINHSITASAIRFFIKANPQWGYVVIDDLVLPMAEPPSVEYLRSLLSNPITAPKVQPLIEEHPEWEIWMDESGELWGF